MGEKEQVLHFISVFTANGKRDQVIETFANGCCFWFANILYNRFLGSQIYYDQVENHFAVKIGERLYDITGDCTEQYPGMEPWWKLDDTSLRSRIYRDCVNFSEEV